MLTFIVNLESDNIIQMFPRVFERTVILFIKVAYLYAGVVGRVVLCNWSPVCTVKYRQSTLDATLSLTLTPCKSIQGGLGFQGDSRSFHTGIDKLGVPPRSSIIGRIEMYGSPLSRIRQKWEVHTIITIRN